MVRFGVLSPRRHRKKKLQPHVYFRYFREDKLSQSELEEFKSRYPTGIYYQAQHYSVIFDGTRYLGKVEGRKPTIDKFETPMFREPRNDEPPTPPTPPEPTPPVEPPPLIEEPIPPLIEEPIREPTEPPATPKRFSPYLLGALLAAVLVLLVWRKQ